MSQLKLHNILNLIVILPLLLGFFACTSLTQYGARYPKQEKELVIGIPPSAQVMQGLNETRQARANLLGREELAHRYARCMYFRNQLLVAANYTNGEWTPDAHNVNMAAKDLERAYQKSDSDFLRICEEQLETTLGKTFGEQWPKQLSPPDAGLEANEDTNTEADTEAEADENADSDNTDKDKDNIDATADNNDT